jgi:hypothetical protein
METFSFAVHVKDADLSGQYEDPFFEAGCNDATIIVIDGHLRLDFDREAASYRAAVTSAMDDVERAGVRVAFVEPLPAV